MSPQTRASAVRADEFNRTLSAKNVGKPATIRARDVLVTELIEAPVIHVAPRTTVREVALLLAKKKISGVPVVDQGEVIGVITEGDLIRRHELGDTTSVAEQLPHNLNVDHSKTHGVFASDVMTRNVITVCEDTPLPDIIKIMLDKNIRRVLVMRAEKLVGVISRSDIVRVLAARPEGAGEPLSDDDDIIRFKVIETMTKISRTNSWLVTVSNGIVELDGCIDDEVIRQSSYIAIKNVPHVVDVIDRRSSIQSC